MAVEEKVIHIRVPQKAATKKKFGAAKANKQAVTATLETKRRWSKGK